MKPETLKLLPLNVWRLPATTLTGIRMAHPTMERIRNIFRHILMKRRNIAASNPTFSITACSFVLMTGVTHANRPLPTGGGACFSSACRSLGAYTTVFHGRKRQKTRAITIVMANEVATDAKTASDCIYKTSANGIDAHQCGSLPV